MTSVLTSRRYVTRTFDQYKRLFKWKNWFTKSIRFENGFLKEYRIDRMEIALRNEKKNVELYIELVEQEGEAVRSRRWLPISLLAVITFSIWNEYIGFRFKHLGDQARGIDVLRLIMVDLVPSALALFLIIWFARYALSIFVLSK